MCTIFWKKKNTFLHTIFCNFVSFLFLLSLSLTHYHTLTVGFWVSSYAVDKRKYSNFKKKNFLFFHFCLNFVSIFCVERGVASDEYNFILFWLFVVFSFCRLAVVSVLPFCQFFVFVFWVHEVLSINVLVFKCLFKKKKKLLWRLTATLFKFEFLSIPNVLHAQCCSLTTPPSPPP
jgi:hypothetical protein